MSFQIRVSALVAVICLAGGCFQEPEPEPEPVPLTPAQALADAKDEIVKLQAELLRTKNQLRDVNAKIAETEMRLFAATATTTKAKRDEMTEEERAFARLEGAERAGVLQILEKAKRGEPLTAEMVKQLDDVHVGSKYVKKFFNDENLSDAERAALKGAN